MEIEQNVLVKLNGEVVRVVHINVLSHIAYVVEMNSFKWPYLVTIQDIKEAKADYESQILEESSYIRFVLEEELSTSEKLKRDRDWEIVQFILRELKDEELFIHKYRAPILKKAEQVFNVGYKTLKKYLLNYWKGGATKNALLPFYQNCGGKGKEKKVGDIKRGRPKKLSKQVGVNIDEHMKRVFKKGINSYYYTERKNSLKVAYELTIKEYFCKEMRDKSGVKILVLDDRIPSYEQFLYWYKKNKDIKKEVSTRKSSKEYYQLNRAIVGNSTLDSGLAPGNLFQIDSTILDCYLTSMLDRNVIVGRPVLYTIMDVYSRCIMGICLTFESFNGYTGAMMALENAMTSKVEYCKRYGIDITEEQWPWAVPLKILADRGELENKQIETAITNLGISIQNTPPYRADYKGIIESSFAQMHTKIKPFAQGVVSNSKNILERGEKDYRLRADLNLFEMTQIIIKSVLFHNKYHVLSEYVTNEMQVAEGIEKIPIKIWNHGTLNIKGYLRTLQAEEIRFNLLPRQQATVTPKGVLFQKLLYVSEALLKSNDFSRARTKGTWKMWISYDPRDLSKIYKVSNDGKCFEELVLVDYLEKFKGMDIAEVNCLIEKETIAEEQGKHKELQAKIELFKEIEKITDKAKEQAKGEQNTKTSKRRRLEGIKENLKEERKIERKFTNQKQNEVNNEEDKPPAQDQLELFRQLQDRWGNYNGY